MPIKNIDLSLIVMAAGNSSRFCSETLTPYRIKKQWLRTGTLPLWEKVANDFSKLYEFKKIIVTASKEDFEYMKKISDFEIVLGGNSRQESIKNALDYIQTEFVLITDAARWNIDKNVLKRLLEKFDDSLDCIAPYLNVSDTTMYEGKYVNRESLKLIQTPQISRLNKLKSSLKNQEFSDESSAITNNGGKVEYVQGSVKLSKITYQEDIHSLTQLPPPSSNIFSGSGFDVHSFEKNKPMFLGGVKIESDFGFAAHSDGDVALHALCDAILGAIGGGDIGEWFPDTDMVHKNADSKVLLKKIYDFALSVGFELVNADITILAQVPKISPYKSQIKECIAKILYTDKAKINIKATTTENLGFIGRKEGVCAIANVNLRLINWKEKI
ncbi:bifunctional 2-C-methyl-D-erythritol 4-phosphate cytidylyltransferase/2-C-methyl-D-erythritol 2,4-cyclodiphosphate synthase [Helicobacter cappadocius]|uniref:Bifunctional enzyme IspD/IspF n=1 Tax=Helicobacter cappadocius TaxID=3063998 RepID=A0AA90PUB5_9HELI|nr:MULTISPECIES: bifunctional 2-C-methyl-D-erythritol 4-phosphate cytidylyltransferase/2-C-methyl-D-erythritol 2,4-cyclodiphosphate synthase [unclassified Helicobacter]MDO7253755.1 bifunctional 2-C-methyl-D-erythritol 4-phosphate cytidylyltransferase/2-C-methyl-D-erythritol 2,4-cyclodiphosphate synthase [Helicobacter sp. faydin-H75]MDP2539684.1 bifunctional 2-C-methyl-D-erythritol 4-phosphate cytidylyltransferase/2-C-methyl-D-erythritol 2,4-cyclodiphosphate synthase [Helicobacter sp. faydin-H76]